MSRRAIVVGLRVLAVMAVGVISTAGGQPASADPADQFAGLAAIVAAGDNNRRCFTAVAPDDLFIAPMTGGGLPTAGAPLVATMLSIGRYVIDSDSGDTGFIFGVRATIDNARPGVMQGGDCGESEGTIACTNTCIGGGFILAKDGDGLIATPITGALRFLGALSGDCDDSGGAAYPMVVANGDPALRIRFAPTDPAHCAPMIEPLDLKSVQ